MTETTKRDIRQAVRTMDRQDLLDTANIFNLPDARWRTIQRAALANEDIADYIIPSVGTKR